MNLSSADKKSSFRTTLDLQRFQTQKFLQVFLKITLSLPYSCHQLIIYANRLDPDQDRQNAVGPDLDPNSLKLSVPEKLILKKVSR